MKIAHTIAELREHVAHTRERGRRVGLVPTMGALHEGHLRLCDLARDNADTVVLSIFVNPLQFAPTEDFERYPRDLKRDARLVAERGVDIIFAPDVSEIYPHGTAQVRVHAPSMSEVLCGRFRPGHFEGVLTVVAKLFNIVEPDCAVFGQKDLQQSVLIRRMTRDLDFDIEILVGPIVREPDGLAMSSRNVYLSAEERRSALALCRSLQVAQQAFDRGVMAPDEIVAAAAATLDAEAGVVTQYVAIVDPESLETPDRVKHGDAVAVAAHVGGTRLIDNHVLD